MASNLALLANLAWCRTNFLTFLSYPIFFSDLLSSEVRIVTPTILVLPEIFFTAFKASKPELTCIVK